MPSRSPNWSVAHEVQPDRARDHGEAEDRVGEVVQRPRRRDDRPSTGGHAGQAAARGRRIALTLGGGHAAMIAAAPGTMTVMDALEIVRAWRPQTFGSKSSNGVTRPDRGAALVRAAIPRRGRRTRPPSSRIPTATRSTDFPSSPRPWRPPRLPPRSIVDGYVTAEVVHGGVGTYTGVEQTGVARQDRDPDLARVSVARATSGASTRVARSGCRTTTIRSRSSSWTCSGSMAPPAGHPAARATAPARRGRDRDGPGPASGTFVRPPIDTWVGSWRSMGFPGLSFKAANSRYAPGVGRPRLGQHRDAAPLDGTGPAPRRPGWYGEACPERHSRRPSATRSPASARRTSWSASRASRTPPRSAMSCERPRPGSSSTSRTSTRSSSTPMPDRPTAPVASSSRPSRRTTSSRSCWSGPRTSSSGSA